MVYSYWIEQNLCSHPSELAFLGSNQLSLLIPCAWLSCLLRQKSFQTRPGVLQANKQRLASNEQFFENSSCPRCSFVVKYLSRSSISLSSQIRIFILSSPFKKNIFGQNFKNESWQEIAVGQNFYSFYAEASRKCNKKNDLTQNCRRIKFLLLF